MDTECSNIVISGRNEREDMTLVCHINNILLLNGLKDHLRFFCLGYLLAISTDSAKCSTSFLNVSVQLLVQVKASS